MAPSAFRDPQTASDSHASTVYVVPLAGFAAASVAAAPNGRKKNRHKTIARLIITTHLTLAALLYPLFGGALAVTAERIAIRPTSFLEQ